MTSLVVTDYARCATLIQVDALMREHPEHAAQLCEQLLVETRLAEPLFYLQAASRYGKIMDHLGRSNDARNTLFAAQQIAQSYGMARDEAVVLERLARGFYSAGDYRQAVQYWESCIELGNRVEGDAETWVLAKVGLAQVCNAAGDVDAALTMLVEAQSRTVEVDDPHLAAKVKINLGVGLIEQHALEQAAEVLKEARVICADNRLFDYLAESNFYLGKIALAAGALAPAMDYLDTALASARQVNFRWCEGRILALKAEVCARSGSMQEALQTVHQAQAIAKADGFSDMLIRQHFAAAEYAAALQDFRTAFLESKAGRDCEQNAHVNVPLERALDDNGNAQSQQSLNRLLLDLSNHDVIDHGDLEPAFELITRESAQILGVSRASLWLLDAQIGALVCRCLFLSSGQVGPREHSLRSTDYPLYFTRLTDPCPLVAHDALHHPHTVELVQSYLRGHDIRSTLIYPIRLAGQTIGTLCFEAVGVQRNWSQDDLLHGKQLAEVSARVITSYEHKMSREEITALNSRLMSANKLLEERVMERTVSLERHAMEMHALHDKLSELTQSAHGSGTVVTAVPDGMEQSAQRLRALVQLSSDWSWEQDETGVLSYVDGHGLEKSGLSAEFMLGRRFRDFPVENLSEVDWDHHDAAVARHEPFFELELQVLDTQQQRHWIALSGEPVAAADGRFIGYRGIGKEITARKQNDDRIQYLATHDSLTGLANRLLFSEFLNRAVQAGRRYERRFAVVFIDLDRFKIINDTLGHDAGDTLLQTISGRLLECLRVSDVVARLGGDEFVVLLQEIDSEEHASSVAAKLLAAVVRPVTLLGQECWVSASIGICMYTGAEDEQAMMKNADSAMYRAKKDGKNRFCFYDAELADASVQRLLLENSLQGALESRQFVLAFQPRQALASGAITGAEALLRWRHPDLGELQPAQFLALAEDSGLIVAIGRWVLHEACRQNVAWQRSGLAAVDMAVNLSARQFYDDALLADVASALQKSGMDPALLELELTESVLVRDVERAGALLQAIKKMGVRVTIDHFGTGYSSLTQLKHLAVDTLKLDQCFVGDLPGPTADQAIACAMIDLGRTLGLRVVAVGVERSDQLAFLRASHCDDIQGYCFSEPIDADAFFVFWRAHLVVTN